METLYEVWEGDNGDEECVSREFLFEEEAREEQKRLREKKPSETYTVVRVRRDWLDDE